VRYQIISKLTAGTGNNLGDRERNLGDSNRKLDNLDIPDLLTEFSKIQLTSIEILRPYYII
jgi:hypothetical protein